MRRFKYWAATVILFGAVIAGSIYRFNHIDLTETRLFLKTWWYYMPGICVYLWEVIDVVKGEKK